MLQPELPPTKTMYRALVNRDPSYEGIFYAAIKTTGIFCRPTCRARKPRPENTEYYRSTREALMHGYRPCKVCDPMHRLGETPPWLSPLLELLEKEPTQKIRDQQMREMSLDPARVRRWFKRHHQMTFHAYQRSLRINHAFGTMKQGEAVTTTAFASGYDSLSGFQTAFKNVTKISPVAAKDKPIIAINRVSTPLGPMLAGASETGLCLLEFTDRKMLETQLDRVSRRLKASLIRGNHPRISQVQSELDEYFSGSRIEFSVPLHLAGTTFQEEVWHILGTIPYGATRSYKDQAAMLGKPQAVRAVARANGDNRISIIVPCHRVVGSDGKLVGYGGGLWRKKWLLDQERAHS
ncbi:MAG: methylated-DNA--[protein]-cysteine S-methyltransferase [Saprospiraceae bacterium]|nr:methylated-DNA--[protein]-cysteine S-methyltransferase [Saprospiraceae bacterium]